MGYNTYIFNLLILITFHHGVKTLQQCPSSMPNSACECIDIFGNRFLSCNNVTDNELKESLIALKGIDLTEIKIKNSILKSIPSKPLRDINVTRVKLLDSTMFYLFDRPLEGAIATSLSSINLHVVEFELGLDWTLFEEVTTLEEFLVSSSDLQRVSEQLTSLGPIVTLQLSDDELEFVHEKAFSDLNSLRNLILKNNYLEEFQREMLPLPTSDLNVLDLSNNKLSQLPHNVFDGMPKLNSLMLYGNSFVVLEKIYMEKIWSQLFYFDVKNTPLDCSCEMSWVSNSPSRPYHLFGRCREVGLPSSLELREIEAEYFQNCL